MVSQGETNLQEILKSLRPKLNAGDFVFCQIDSLHGIDLSEVVSTFKEEEGTTIVIKKELADTLNLSYTHVFSWITLMVHSSLTAVGLTAAFSKILTEKGISCNVVAAHHHDHIFVEKSDTNRAMKALNELSNSVRLGK